MVDLLDQSDNDIILHTITLFYTLASTMMLISMRLKTQLHSPGLLPISQVNTLNYNVTDQ